MRISTFLLCVFLLSSSLYGGVLEYITFQEAHNLYDSDSVAVKIIKKADYVAIPVTVSSSQRQAKLRNKDLEETKKLIFKKAKASNLRVEEGVVSLSTRKGNILSSFNHKASSFNFILLMPFKKKKTIYNCTEELVNFIHNIKLKDKVKCHHEGSMLVVNDPEQYRHQIIKMIFKDLDKIKDMSSTETKFSINNLQNPVSLRQHDAENVELYINYDFTVQLE